MILECIKQILEVCFKKNNKNKLQCIMNYSDRFFFFMGHTVTCNFIKICHIISLPEIEESAPFHCVNPQLEENAQEITRMF